MNDSGFNIVYGYTESDEISLLFQKDDNTFGRKVRKINSTLSAEASAFFSLKLRQKATFDCRVVPLPNINRVMDYFAWRQEDSHRNSLNAWTYWTLRKEGKSIEEATFTVEGKSVADKNEILFQRGINYNDLPTWQKRGTGVYYTDVVKEGFNPITNEKALAKRRELKADFELPLEEEYRLFIKGFIE